ncbi:MAG: biotin/lipoyl-binding protein, partial [Pseudomonadales bacterium]|nr:biotin/lipoyl-binding protein [Pseudomonadales bacterium]
IARFADKGRAKAEAVSVDVPVIEGSEAGSDDPDQIRAWAKGRQFPILLKATAGGGGRGIRIIEHESELDDQIDSAMREAKASFGRADLLVEQYVASSRHIEVQILGDGNGNVMHLFERECSLQRRQQKVIEEAPAPGMSDELRERITEAACRIGEAAQYRGLGTVEFLLSGENFYFLELNPRLQVEHPVTEYITGLDLVELQLKVCANKELPLKQSDVAIKGHSVEARVYAEDVKGGFVPSTGKIHNLFFDDSALRIDCGVNPGESISPFYDSMLAKLIAYGSDRKTAIQKLSSGLSKSYALGVQTNIAFLSSLLANDDVKGGVVDNGFIDRHIDSLLFEMAPSAEEFALVGLAKLMSGRQENVNDPWTRINGFSSWKISQAEYEKPSNDICIYKVDIEGTEKKLSFSSVSLSGELIVFVDEEQIPINIIERTDTDMLINVDGRVQSIRWANEAENLYLFLATKTINAKAITYLESVESEQKKSNGRIQAPVMGLVVKVNVKEGDQVLEGDVLVVQESMKMELAIPAPKDGIVSRLMCGEGDMIERHSLVAEIA